MAQNILFIASEMTPFIKTGGLGDVVGALPKSLASEHGVNVKVIIPLYSSIDYQKYGLFPRMQGNCVNMGNCQEFFSVHQSNFVAGVETYFIEYRASTVSSPPTVTASCALPTRFTVKIFEHSLSSAHFVTSPFS